VTDRARGHRVGTDGEITERQNRPHLRIAVLDGFRLDEEGVRVLLPEGSQRLLAFLALKGTIRRSIAAGKVRPTVPQDHASSNPRSALARLKGARAGVNAIEGGLP
jgi:SARP family transcriptional regulator, regulator of embCAB operon